MTLIDNLKSRLKECQKCSSQSSTPPAEIFSRWTPSLEAYKQEAKQFLETLSHNLSREWAHDQSPWKKHSSADDLYESRRGLRSQKNFRRDSQHRRHRWTYDTTHLSTHRMRSTGTRRRESCSQFNVLVYRTCIGLSERTALGWNL